MSPWTFRELLRPTQAAKNRKIERCIHRQPIELLGSFSPTPRYHHIHPSTFGSCKKCNRLRWILIKGFYTTVIFLYMIWIQHILHHLPPFIIPNPIVDDITPNHWKNRKCNERLCAVGMYARRSVVASGTEIVAWEKPCLERLAGWNISCIYSTMILSVFEGTNMFWIELKECIINVHLVCMLKNEFCFFSWNNGAMNTFMILVICHPCRIWW